ncbi:oxygenase MpaB family protein [Acidovorax sp. LjRoot117]|uniref:oxygenase MpaB family protein n=1 Tax=Acidovorax sp. LjRoot117 TaxID=3342255 RepID=UPI003ECC1F6A
MKTATMTNSRHFPLPDAELAGMQHHADPLADQTIADMLGPWPPGMVDADAEQWKRLDTVNILLGQWADNAGIAQWTVAVGPVHGTVGGKPADGYVDQAMADALNHYVRTAQVLPDWADARQIERAEKLFMEHGALSCILLFCASLPECYVIPDLSAVLHTAGQLEQNTEYRIRSTAAMIFPVMMHGGLSERGAGVAQVLKVRLIHATIRNLILHGSPQRAVDHLKAGDASAIAPTPLPANGGRGVTMFQMLHARGWDVADDGLPCNQEELAYTLLTFGYVFLRSLHKLGIGLPRHEEEAYLHAWNVVGHVLGIERSLMVDTMEQGQVLMAQMQARGRADPISPDPRPALGQALMQTMAKALPWDIVKPFPQLMTRYLCGRDTASDLGLTQPVPWSSALLFWVVLIAARVLDAVVRLAMPRFSIVRALTRVLGYHFMSRVLMSQTRPLQLPTALLNQVDDVVHSWSDDPNAPRWLNRLEDRLTTHGSWSLGLGRTQKAQATGSAQAQRPA